MKNILKEHLTTRLQRRIARPVRLVLHDNRRVMLSFRHLNDGRISLRLHHMFLSAQATQLGAIARFVRSKDPVSRRAVEAFIARYKHLIGVELPASIHPGRGRVYDLQKMFDALNKKHFKGRVKASIHWGKSVQRDRRRTIRLGYYCDDTKKIVLNPVLDRKSVPKYMVEWIVFHEMLHQVIGFHEMNGMMVAHTPEFRRREQAFPLYAKASGWEARNLDRLLRA